MYWETFERLFEAFGKRQAVEDLRGTRDAVIAGIWGNSNYDGDGKTPAERPKLLETVHHWYRNGVAQIYEQEQVEFEIDQDDPFFKAMQLPEVPEAMKMDEARAQAAREQAQIMADMRHDQG